MPNKQADRLRYLNHLYERVGGRSSAHVPMWELGQELGMEKEYTSDIVEYLVNEGYVERRVMGGGIGISHRGVRQVEQSNADPNTAIGPFPAVNVINVQNMHNSQIQQGSHQSSQTQSFSQNDLKALGRFLAQVRAKMADPSLPPAIRHELQANVATIDAQLQSARPKRGIVVESLRSIRTVLEEAGGNIVAAGLLPLLAPLLAALGG